MSKTASYLLSGCILVILLIGTFSGGLVMGWVLKGPVTTAAGQFQNPAVPSQAGSNQPATPSNLKTLFDPFWESWNLVHDQYVDQPVDDLKLMRGAISGMLGALGDEHTSYMDPDLYRSANMPMEGEYEGIGATMDTSVKPITVVSPFPDSPAEKAGIKPGDQVIKVDGEDVSEMDGSLVVRKVLGPSGTKVTLTIVRKGETEPFDLTITRAKIVLHSVTSKMLDNNIAYVQLTSFGDKSTEELKSTLSDLMAKNPKGLILDLRNNGGGYLQTAVEVISQFVPKGTVLIERYGDGSEKKYEAEAGGLATKIPLVVLVNKGSASASEITAGAIQDYKRGTLVGETTFGKGSVQIWTPLQDDQGAVRITIARWLTPNGRQIHKVGLEPDVKVELTEDDFKAGRDPQLDKAIEVLSQSK